METKVCKKCLEEKPLCEYNKDKYSKDGLRYRCKECTRKEYKKFYYSNIDREIERQISYQKNNMKTVKENRNKRHNKKYYEDVLYKLKFNIRNRVKLFLKSTNFDIKTNNTFNIIGCTPEELKVHIESKFTDGMRWDNHNHKGWHIDHIVPLSSANSVEEIFKLSHYTNLQPLWCEENYKKGKKII